METKKCSAIRQVSSAPNLDGLQEKLEARLEENKEEETQVPRLRYVKSDVGMKRKLSIQV